MIRLLVTIATPKTIKIFIKKMYFYIFNRDINSDFNQNFHPIFPNIFYKTYIVDEKRKIIYFNIPKVACSSIKRTFLDAEIILEKDDHIHRLIFSLQKTRLSKKQKSFYKFSFVRNPFDRLYSFYKNKFITNFEDKKYLFPYKYFLFGYLNENMSLNKL